jgi:excisionase family DNA binding protein
MLREELSALIDKLPKDNAQVSDESMSIEQLAVYLKCTPGTVKNYKKRRAIPYHQTGRKIYFLKSEVDAALASKMPRK